MKSRFVALAAMATLVSSAAVAAADSLTDAVVKKLEAGQITLQHGPIENLGRPGMTMGFKVKDPALLKDVKPGDKLRVRIEEVDGRYTVVRVVPVK